MYVLYLIIAVFANIAIAVVSYTMLGFAWASISLCILAFVAAVATVISGFLRLPP